MKKKILKGIILLSVNVFLLVNFNCADFSCSCNSNDFNYNASRLSACNNNSGMIPISSGTFTMGHEDLPNAMPHTATLTIDFSIGETEVTYDLWYKVKKWAVAHGYSFVNPGREGDDGKIGGHPTSAKNEPVTTVGWYDAVKWCNALSEKEGYTPVYYVDDAHTIVYRTGDVDLSNDAVLWDADGYRLPTEAEWEFAARNRGARNGYEWSGDNTVDTVAWYLGNSGLHTHPVKGKNANELGIYDMTGNVWEWVWDWHRLFVNASPYTDADPHGPTSCIEPHRKRRVYRGGSWGFCADNCVVSRRYDGKASNGYDFIGFRIVRVH